MGVLRAGLVGLGAMGRNHARVLSALDGVRFVGVVDPYSDSEHPNLLSSLDEMIDLDLDYCVVAVPTSLHEEVALRLADAGVHALVEKPLAQDSLAAQRIAAAFDEAGLVGAVGHIERFNPALVAARERIASGDLGQVYQISTRRQGPFPSRIADVGVVMDLATHDVDLCSWLMGSQYGRVSAEASFRSGRQHEDLISISGSLVNGIITNHLVNWLAPFKERVTTVVGESGAFVIDTLHVDLTHFFNGESPTEWEAVAKFRGVSEGDIIRYSLKKREPLLAEHEAFRAAVLNQPSEIVSMSSGVRAVSVAESVLLSAREHRTVEVVRG